MITRTLINHEFFNFILFIRLNLDYNTATKIYWIIKLVKYLPLISKTYWAIKLGCLYFFFLRFILSSFNEKSHI